MHGHRTILLIICVIFNLIDAFALVDRFLSLTTTSKSWFEAKVFSHYQKNKCSMNSLNNCKPITQLNKVKHSVEQAADCWIPQAPKRQKGNTTCIWYDWSSEDDTETVLIKLDWSKAFDMFEYWFISVILEAITCDPPYFILIQFLYQFPCAFMQVKHSNLFYIMQQFWLGSLLPVLLNFFWCWKSLQTQMWSTVVGCT